MHETPPGNKEKPNIQRSSVEKEEVTLFDHIQKGNDLREKRLSIRTPGRVVRERIQRAAPLGKLLIREEGSSSL